MNRGFSAESSNAVRSFAMAMLRAWSKSPKLSLVQTRPRNSSLRDDLSRTLQQDLQQLHGLLLDPDSQTRFAHFARLERNLIGSESHDGGGSQGFHGAFGVGREV